MERAQQTGCRNHSKGSHVGDEALFEYNTRFDGNSRTRFRVTQQEIDAAYAQMSEQELEDLRQAAENIRTFAQAQRDCFKELNRVSMISGSCLGHRVIPVESCGCYVPGGSYPFVFHGADARDSC